MSTVRIAIINDTSPSHHFGCLLVMQNLRYLLQQHNIEVLWSWPVSTDWRQQRKQFESLPEVDAFIINGEGTLHNNASRRFSQALVDFCQAYAPHKPVYLLNATLHNNTADAYQTLSLCRKIFVRDRNSLTELQQHDVDGQYAPDLTFARRFATENGSTPTGVLVTDSAVKQDSAWLKALAESKHYNFRSMVVAHPANARFLRSPRPYVKNVIRWLISDRHLSLEPSDYIADMKRHAFVITGRYHTVTMCLKHQIPFVTLESNTPKVRALLNDVFSAGQRSVSRQQIEADDLDALRLFSVTEVQAMEDFSAMAEQRIQAMIAAVVEDIRSHV